MTLTVTGLDYLGIPMAAAIRPLGEPARLVAASPTFAGAATSAALAVARLWHVATGGIAARPDGKGTRRASRRRGGRDAAGVRRDRAAPLVVDLAGDEGITVVKVLCPDPARRERPSASRCV